MMPLSRGLSSGRTLARGHREACWGLKIWSFHPHDSTKTPFIQGALLLVAGLGSVIAQSKLPPEAHRGFSDPPTYAPDRNEHLTTRELRDFVGGYGADRQALQRVNTWRVPKPV